MRFAGRARSAHTAAVPVPAPCSASCRRVLGSFSASTGGSPASRAPEDAFDHGSRRLEVRHPGRPRPTCASSASARIEARRKPPVLQLPGPRRRCSPRPRSRGDLRQRLATDQGGPPPRQRAFVGARGSASYSRRATAQLRTESPRNSSRSLCSPAGAAVGERDVAQRGICEHMAERRSTQSGSSSGVGCGSLHLHGLVEMHHERNVRDVGDESS